MTKDHMLPALRTRVFACTSRVDALDFDEHDVRSLYGLLREYADPHGLTYEVANFFSHPRRDRGIIHKRTKPIVEALNAAGRETTALPRISPLKHTAIIEDLDLELERHGLPGVRRDNSDALGLVTLVALQSSSLTLAKDSNVSIYLFVPDGMEIALCAFTPQFLDLGGAVFPIVTMPNNLGIPRYMPHPDRPGGPILTASYTRGMLKIAQTAEPLIAQFPADAERLEGAE